SRDLYKHLNHVADELLEQGKSVIFDTNFNFRADRDYMRKIAAKHGAETIVIWVHTPRQLAKERATEQSEDQETRVWGNMPTSEFDRMSNNLQQPDSDEHVVAIDGTNVTEETIKQALHV